MSQIIAFIDSEISEKGKVLDIGAVTSDGKQFHAASQKDFAAFVKDCDFLCGHNIIAHDLKYLGTALEEPHKGFSHCHQQVPIDTLPLSPLLFPKKPYHALLKDDKLLSDELNNPLNDALKAQHLFYDEVNAFAELPENLQGIYASLLGKHPDFQGFFQYVGFHSTAVSEEDVRSFFEGKICANAKLKPLMKAYPVELAYALALIFADDRHSITPPWVLHHYPQVENILRLLRNVPCGECSYCRQQLDVRNGLKQVFGFDHFRSYDGEPLQEMAAAAAMNGESLLAIFPTGGGKSLTFQLPAIMQGEATHGLTVIISPLQSLMKDQVDNLEARGFVDAVTINGLQNNIERSEAINRVASGLASLLYISPEQLRSNTIERLLIKRSIVRFVIDEAHCFSAWGQDFRVDYLYIGKFIRHLQEAKHLDSPIPVSCFTATAKQKVVSDICGYFKQTLNLNLKLFTSKSTRKNLHYTVLYKDSDEEKYATLRDLIASKECSTIVYVSRTRQTVDIAERLSKDGVQALPFNGKMDPQSKVANQEAFMEDRVKVMVATSAFGMGVDKKDVKLVVHYDISNSLENYIQEAGRAGRDESLQAECYVLFNENDLNKHFLLLNQTKLSMSEIQQVWRAVKEKTRKRNTVTCSALEIARQAGWDDSVADIETRVKTALAALETAGYIQRGKNTSHLYATSILVRNMQEAVNKIEASPLFDPQQRTTATRIIKSLISAKHREKSKSEEAESRVDYLSDILGVPKSEVIEVISLLRQAKILADKQDMSAYIRAGTTNRSAMQLKSFIQLEMFLVGQLQMGGNDTSLKELNEAAIAQKITFSSTKNIKAILHFWITRGYIQKTPIRSDRRMQLIPTMHIEMIRKGAEERGRICQFIVDRLYVLAKEKKSENEEVLVQFSLISLWESYKRELQNNLFERQSVSCHEIETALLYLTKLEVITLEGGFMVLYNGMIIRKLTKNNSIQYKKDDYRQLDEHYKQKIQQIHIVGEFANLMVRDYGAALQFVSDYFQMEYKSFISRYFKGERAKDIEINITPNEYKKLFGELSEVQRAIIRDQSQYIVVAAGPGSGKTKVLVHKLASLLLLEDVKHEQLLMLTFSRAAATEFKQRLFQLIGSAAAFVEIKTFHSYCFDLLGKIGTLEDSSHVVAEATRKIRSGEVEAGRITKSVLVIDEAQDMDADEFALVQALMARNEEMRVVAVGDDDQNIYEFRGASSSHFGSLVQSHHAAMHELVDNYRSKRRIVELANRYVQTIEKRMKSKPICAISQEEGVAELVRHRGGNLEQPIVEHIAKCRPSGCSVLTTTNEDALRVCALLNRRGIKAKLIQSNDGFRLSDLVEVRAFRTALAKQLSSPLISDIQWNKAKEKLQRNYANSTCLPNVLNMLKVFENSNKRKYHTDFEEFVNESQYDDFYDCEQDTVVVSTIHKAKGREFSTVYMLLDGVVANTDEQRHKLYVGMTRAKEALYIHCNNDLFAGMLPEESVISDATLYEEPEELELQLTHRDVVLDFFKGWDVEIRTPKKILIFRLRSGDALNVSGHYLLAAVDGRAVPVLKFSKAFVERLSLLQEHGYQIVSATIRFIVAWKGKDDAEESAVVLPDMLLRKG